MKIKEEILHNLEILSEEKRKEILHKIFEIYCKECFRKMDEKRGNHLICYCTWDW